VTFEYAEGRPVLHDIDLELEPGRTVALIGHTGSGKTTFAALVPRFYDVTEGRITIDGVDVRDVKLQSLRREIGIVAQDPFLFSATVRENIAFGRADATDEDVERARRSRRLTTSSPRSRRATTRHRRARDHALGGQRQRLAIARRLIMEPRILILDDATASSTRRPRPASGSACARR
jgi:ATP-binding cassette subfamily B protein